MDILKKCFIRLLSFGWSLSMKCVSMSNKACQSRATVIDVNSSKSLDYPLGCTTIGHPYVRICVPGKVKSYESERI